MQPTIGGALQSYRGFSGSLAPVGAGALHLPHPNGGQACLAREAGELDVGLFPSAKLRHTQGRASARGVGLPLDGNGSLLVYCSDSAAVETGLLNAKQTKLESCQGSQNPAAQRSR